VNLSVFEERPMIVECHGILKELSFRLEDESQFVVKSISLAEWVEQLEIEKPIEILISFRHLCIAPLIGFAPPSESGVWRELKTVRFYLESCSCAEDISICPLWLTSTIKAKAVAGLVLSLRPVDSFGLLHRRLTVNIVFSIQIMIFISYWNWGKSKVKKDQNLEAFRMKNVDEIRMLRGLHQVL
jgi:hypothetical protein